MYCIWIVIGWTCCHVLLGRLSRASRYQKSLKELSRMERNELHRVVQVLNVLISISLYMCFVTRTNIQGYWAGPPLKSSTGFSSCTLCSAHSRKIAMSQSLNCIKLQYIMHAPTTLEESITIWRRHLWSSAILFSGSSLKKIQKLFQFIGCSWSHKDVHMKHQKSKYVLLWTMSTARCSENWYKWKSN